MSKFKKNHITAKTHLKGFTDSQGILYESRYSPEDNQRIVDKRMKKPDKVGYKNYYTSFKNKEGNVVIKYEEIKTELENELGPILHKIRTFSGIKSIDLREGEKIILLQYIALLIGLSEQVDQKLNASISNVMNSFKNEFPVGTMINHNGSIQPITESIYKELDQIFAVGGDAIKQSKLEGKFQRLLGDQDFILEFLLERKRSFFEVPKKRSLLTSDVPVYIRPHNANLKQNNSVLFFSISEGIFLMIGNKTLASIDLKVIDSLNRYFITNAQGFIISKSLPLLEKYTKYKNSGNIPSPNFQKS